MELLGRFKDFIAENHLLNRADRILLAVSGGKDSMLMLKLFYELGMNIEVAHCNFGLRSKASDGDEQIVRDYCALLKVPLYVKRFDTKGYASVHKLSIQMAARSLRYTWFEGLAEERNCSVIAIAQHKNDHVETVLLNLARGTGLQGLRGILPKRGNIIRPLLFLNATEINQAVVQLAIPYRDDASNFSTKYSRNKIRLDIIPQFEQLNPDFIHIMNDNILRFQEAYQVLHDFVQSLRQQLFAKQNDNQWIIFKKDLQDKEIGLLFLLFEPFGFHKAILEDFQASLNKESGRIFEAPSYELLLDREVVILRRISEEQDSLMVLEGQEEITWRDKTFKLIISDDSCIVRDAQIAKLDFDKLLFPLEVRTWREGDYFQPLGMKGRRKISDFFIGKKINVFEKGNIPIWINGNGDVLWVGGYQIDNRYRITENTQKVLTLVCANKEV